MPVITGATDAPTVPGSPSNYNVTKYINPTDRCFFLVINLSSQCPLSAVLNRYVGSMEDIKWFNEMSKTDSPKPSESVSGETRYTLYQKDFLQMPDVDFVDLAEIDPDLRALLN